MEEKVCIRCGISKKLSEFSLRSKESGKVKAACKSCINSYSRLYHSKNKEEVNANHRKYYRDNSEQINIRHKEYRDAHKEDIRLYGIDYREKNKEKISIAKKKYRESNKEKMSSYQKEYYKKNLERIKVRHRRYNHENPHVFKKAYKKYRKANVDIINKRRRDNRRVNKKEVNRKEREYINNNINVKIAQNLRRRINHVLNGTIKSKRTMELLGCTIDNFKEYLESKFVDGMSFDNYGEWHIDHIKPCASFDLTDPEQQKECFHYTNLQPLWAIDNLRKGAKIQ